MQGPPHRSQQHLHQHPRGHQHAALRPQRAQSAAATKAYNPRHPERTLLYRTVAEHFATWLELASSTASIGYIPPAEAEANYYRQLASQVSTVEA